ncbi:ABC transporter permease [Sporichthya sp.]|uniref:branched-chain amino acid ABC transporter permease n=1 Tax=Sporichthya sp. TaxID=65475 RepID=UPI0017E35D73|nr:ABC transporter permease [Sporichthya sp.]MBA3745172.1 ABC transporter permease [Sporichthya sp.]
MNEWMPFLIFGIATGSVYGLSAMGLVLTYKTSGVFNLAHGAVGAAAAFMFFDLHKGQGMAWPLAAAIVIVAFGLIGGLLLERLAVVLAGVSTAYKIVGTIGLLVAIRAGITLAYGEEVRLITPFLPQDRAFTVSGVGVTVEQLIVLAVGIGAAVGLALFFRLSRLGTAMRGVVDNPQLLDMAGTPPARVRRSAWVIGTVFSAVSGVLFASGQQALDVNILTLLVVQAFGAATIARFQSLPMAFVGGLAVGVLQKLVSKAVTEHSELQGLDLIVPFLVLFVGLLVIPRASLIEVGRPVRGRSMPSVALPVQFRAAGYAVGLALLVMLPSIAGPKLPAYNIALAQVGLFASLHLLVRTSGQISLMHFGFAAVGAAGFGHSLEAGVPFALAVAIGGLVCLPVALVVSIPAIRLSGLFLGLATLGFGIVLAQFCYDKPFMFGGGALLTRRPSGLESEKAYYYVLLAVAVAAVLLVMAIERSQLGRLLRAMSDSPLALSTLGTSVNISRVLVFTISGFLAGVSGGLYASLFSQATQDSFTFIQSLLALTVLAIAGRSVAVAAFVAPFLLYVLPLYISNATLNQWLQVGFGVGALVVAALSQGVLRDVISRGVERDDERRDGPAGSRRLDPGAALDRPLAPLNEVGHARGSELIGAR